MAWGDQSARDTVDICAKLVLNGEDLPAEAGTDDSERAGWIAARIREVNAMMPSYKAIKYFILSEEELIKTTTLKVRRPLELEKIHAQLAERGLTMKSAHRSMLR